MGLLDFLTTARSEAGNDPNFYALGERIVANLRALGLHVQATRYGSFHEIRASTSPRMITLPDNREASGIAILIAPKYDPPQLVFEQINSLGDGLGARMVEAVLCGLREHPGIIKRLRVNDLSPRMKEGLRWWERLAAARTEFEWHITHDDDVTHRVTNDHLDKQDHPISQPQRLGLIASTWRNFFVHTSLMAPKYESHIDDVTLTPGFAARREKLHALAEAFGYDARKVTLRAQNAAFDYIGQNFLSEGESLPDGNIVIYYDMQMSDARMACCLAHELQHVRYCAVRDAYRSEPANGPLHQRFEKYTAALLAAQRGVSNYSNEHWDAWRSAEPPGLFDFELEQGGSEPINETIAEVAKALYNWGDEVRINPLWKELQRAINEEFDKLAHV